ncbi:MAG: flagellar assembly protein A [Spirochaetaceae bacterium]
MDAERTTASSTDLSITFSESGLEAIAHLGAGSSPDPDALLASAAKAGIRHGLLTDELPALLKEARAEGKREIVIARGTEAVPPRAATFTVDGTLSMPEELATIAGPVLKAAGPPQPYREVKRTETRRRKVEKKPGLPFGKAREEWEAVREEIVEKERVYVDTLVLETVYADSDVLVGTISPETDGTPGKTVLGRELPAAPLADPGFYLGDYLLRRGADVYSQHSGFIRIGTNWADLVPYDNHSWSVTVSEDKLHCTLTYYPGDDEGTRPQAADILEAARDQGFPAEKLRAEDDVQRMIDEAVENSHPLTAVSITEDTDAEVRLVISEDRLRALLTVRKAHGNGSALNLKDIGTVISDAGLVSVDKDRIRADIIAFYKSDATELVDYVVAEGTPPGKGPDTTVDFSLRYLDDEHASLIRERLKADAATAGEGAGIDEFGPDTIQQMALVDEEQRILTIAPAVPGTAGVDVFGAEIPGQTGSEPELRLFGHVERRDTFIIATRSGLLDKFRDGDTIYIRVRPHQDASAEIHLSSDEMAAFARVTPHHGTGQSLTAEAIHHSLKTAGVTHGIRDEGIATALEADRTGDNHSVLVACGTPAMKAGTPSSQLLVELPSAEETERRSTERNSSRGVRMGQPIATVIRNPQKTAEGTTVTGRPQSIDSIQPRIIHAGENVETREEPGIVTLLATQDGELVIREDTAHVLVDLRVAGDVDQKTGRINFPGMVTVTGSVRSGLVVLAGSDVKIGKNVEMALVSAGGALEIGGGVKGGGKAVLRAAGTMRLSFIEHARVLSVGRIEVDSGVVQCNVKCNDELYCTGKSSRIAGGTIRARRGLRVANLGSEKGVRTIVSFGQDFLVEDQIEQLERAIQKARDRVVYLDQKSTEVTGARLATLRKEKVQLLKGIEKRGVKLFILREKFETHVASSVIVTDTLYPGVVFECHGRRHEVKKTRKGVRVTFNPESGRIVLEEM